jgi:hypothetical protein
MCAGAPEVAPFMADEAVLSVPDLGKLDYTQKHYIAYASKIQDKAKELATLGIVIAVLPKKGDFGKN